MYNFKWIPKVHTTRVDFNSNHGTEALLGGGIGCVVASSHCMGWRRGGEPMNANSLQAKSRQQYMCYDCQEGGSELEEKYQFHVLICCNK